MGAIERKIAVKHKQAWAKRINNDDATEEIAGLYHFLGYGFNEFADYIQALKWYRKALAIREEILGKEHPSTATTYNNIAAIYKNQGKYEDALVWYRKDLVISENVFGKDYPNTAVTYNNIAGVYRDQGKYENALE